MRSIIYPINDILGWADVTPLNAFSFRFGTTGFNRLSPHSLASGRRGIDHTEALPRLDPRSKGEPSRSGKASQVRKSRFTEEEIIAILAKQERGLTTAELGARHGISRLTV